MFALIDLIRYFQEVLSSPNLLCDSNEIQLLKDGSWSAHEPQTEKQSLDTPRKSTQKVEVISDDLGENSVYTYFTYAFIHVYLH